jgi:hypothetical protein
MLMYFYGLGFDDVLELSFPRMQILMAEMANVYKLFSPVGKSGSGRRAAPSNAEMLKAMR